MVVENVIITVVGGGFVTLFIGGVVHRRRQRRREARTWYGESIKLLTKIIDRTERELEKDDKIDVDRLMADIDPFVTDLKAHVEDDRGSISKEDIEMMEYYCNYVGDFENTVDHFQKSSGPDFMEVMFDEKKDVLQNSEVDLDAPLRDGFPSEILDMYDHDEIRDAVNAVDLEKEAELKELVQSEIDDDVLYSDEDPPLREIMNFPYSDYGVFDEFEQLLDSSLDVTIEQYTRISLVEMPKMLRGELKRKR